jgi:hypothetical protein
MIVAIAFIDANRPKPIDWYPSYQTFEKKPLGLYVFDTEINSILGSEIEKINQTPYEYLTYFANFYIDEDYENEDSNEYEEDYEEDYALTTESTETLVDSTGTTPNNIEAKGLEVNAEFTANIDNSEKQFFSLEGVFLYINQDFNIDEQSTKTLLQFVSDGNEALISANGFNQILKDSLQFETDYYYNNNDAVNLYFERDAYFKSEYKMAKGFNGLHFTDIDSSSTKTIGYQQYITEKLTNFIAVKYKKGTFYLHTQPAAFSNYHLLKSNHAQYATQILSYIPKEKTVYWFIKSQEFSAISNSPMRYILAQPALKWAWYLFLIGMLLFFIFNAKRRQRIVPIYVSLTNTTVDFIKTIGNLYFQEGNHNTIIDKKIIFFLERIRNEFLIDTQELNDDFIKKLHLKSGKKTEHIQLIVRLIKKSNKTYQNSETDLIAINNAIEKFWK